MYFYRDYKAFIIAAGSVVLGVGGTRPPIADILGTTGPDTLAGAGGADGLGGGGNDVPAGGTWKLTGATDMTGTTFAKERLGGAKPSIVNHIT